MCHHSMCYAQEGAVKLDYLHEDYEPMHDDYPDESHEEAQTQLATGRPQRRPPLPMVAGEDGTMRQLSPKEHRRIRRRLTNRQSALRMRAKRQEELDSVHQQVSELVLMAWPCVDHPELWLSGWCRALAR